MWVHEEAFEEDEDNDDGVCLVEVSGIRWASPPSRMHCLQAVCMQCIDFSQCVSSFLWKPEALQIPVAFKGQVLGS